LPFGDWEPYLPTRPWTLTPGDGTKTVYILFRDAVGKVSASYSDSIVLDTTAPSQPTAPTDAGAYTTNTSVVFNWTAATDTGSGLAGYDCQIGTTAGGSDVFGGSFGNVLSKTMSGSHSSRYYCRVRATDKAGNVGEWSPSSDGISVVAHTDISIAQARALADLASAGLASKTVTAVFDGFFYVGDTDRSSGIRVVPMGGIPSGLVVGKLVDDWGVVKTNSGHERWIEATIWVIP
jgi:hypothetical protein